MDQSSSVQSANGLFHNSKRGSRAKIRGTRNVFRKGLRLSKTSCSPGNRNGATPSAIATVCTPCGACSPQIPEGNSRHGERQVIASPDQKLRPFPLRIAEVDRAFVLLEVEDHKARAHQAGIPDVTI